MAEMRINKIHAKSIVESWLAAGVIVSKQYDGRNKTRGVEVKNYP